MTTETIEDRTERAVRGTIRCPGCAAKMKIRRLEGSSADVDACEACGGLWVDWFDGEVRAIATETLASEAPDTELAGADGPRSTLDPLGKCPVDGSELVSEHYEVTAEFESNRFEDRTSRVAAKTDAELRRCRQCAGSFVSRSAAEVLAALSADESAPPSRSAAELAPLPWQRFVGVLKRVFVGDAEDAKKVDGKKAK